MPLAPPLSVKWTCPVLGNPQNLFEVMKQTGGAAQAADAARFAGRHLAQKRVIHRTAPTGHASYLDHRCLAAWTHITGELAERAFGFAVTGADNSFQNDLGVGWNLEINGFTADQRHSFAAQSACDAELVGAVRKLRDRREHDRRVDADRYRHRHVFFSRIVLSDVTCRVLRATDVQAKPLWSLHLQPVGADVAAAGFGIPGNHEWCGDVWSRILARRPDHLGQDPEIDFSRPV